MLDIKEKIYVLKNTQMLYTRQYACMFALRLPLSWFRYDLWLYSLETRKF